MTTPGNTVCIHDKAAVDISTAALVVVAPAKEVAVE
jgi:hypothetical protein